ncbi:MAG TPA: tripartite tricarboxylate transporter TctB family protein [Mobilitalea sp.]|nr:tripartite tricarboxylate transporter TctB family protein [Mobilitalea sp.]
MKVIKVMNDFVLGVIMLLLSIYLFLTDQVVNRVPKTAQGGFFARADVYIYVLAAILGIVSLIIIIKSLNFKKEEVKGFTFAINDTIIYTVIALVLYVLVFSIVGFIISTFVMVLFLCMMYSVKEQNKKLKEYTKKELIKTSFRALIYSVVTVIILKLVFENGLSVQLPDGLL